MFYIVLLDSYYIPHALPLTNSRCTQALPLTMNFLEHHLYPLLPGQAWFTIAGTDEFSVSVALSSSEAPSLLIAPILSTNSSPNGFRYHPYGDAFQHEEHHPFIALSTFIINYYIRSLHMHSPLESQINPVQPEPLSSHCFLNSTWSSTVTLIPSSCALHTHAPEPSLPHLGIQRSFSETAYATVSSFLKPSNPLQLGQTASPSTALHVCAF